MKKVIRRTEKGDVLVFRPDKTRLLPTFHRLKLAEKNKKTYVVNLGSGGSGKSHATAQFMTELCLSMTKKEKIMVVRKTGNSLEDSTIDEFLSNAFVFWGLEEGRDYKYNISRRTITFKLTGSKIIFKGLDDAEKLKSIPGVTRLWIEEATEISEEEFNIVNDRIRGEPVIYLTFNPISEQHWLKKRFLDSNGFQLDTSGNCPGLYRNLKNDTCVLFSTFLENPFIGSKYIKQMVWYRKHNPDHYRVYGLGLWGLIRPTNPYFSSWKRSKHAGSCKYNPAIHSIYLSMDFNVKNTFLISQREPGQWVNYLALWNGTGDLKEMCNQVVNTFGRHKWYYFTGDGSGNNHSAVSTGNMAAWELIDMYFQQAGVPKEFLNFTAVPAANTSTAASRVIANTLVSYYGPHLQANEETCALLLDDLDRMKALPNGSLDKSDCNKHDYGHAGDTFRYDLQNFDSHILVERFGEDMLKAVSSGNRNNYHEAA